MKLTFSTIIDISLPLTKTTIVYPGNPQIIFTPLVSVASGSRITKISFGSHTGTHIDAPSHAVAGGQTLDQLNLDAFIGSCRVLDLTACLTCIGAEDLRKFDVKAGERILAKTKNSEIGFETFRSDYIYLNPEAADYLANTKIKLFGIDYLSVKQKGSQDNRPHTALLNNNIPILEGINLKEVTAGDYFLMTLPLKFIGIDGSPTRAVLLK